MGQSRMHVRVDELVDGWVGGVIVNRRSGSRGVNEREDKLALEIVHDGQMNGQKATC